MSYELPDDRFIPESGETYLLDQEKVAAEITRLTALVETYRSEREGIIEACAKVAEKHGKGLGGIPEFGCRSAARAIRELGLSGGPEGDPGAEARTSQPDTGGAS